MKSLLAAASLAYAATASCLRLQNLVTFGDSYTDEGRLDYLVNNNGTMPPIGELLSESNRTAGGGRVWPRLIAEKTGTTTINYAVGGASCSDLITPREFDWIGVSFPSVMEYQIPTFKADLEFEEELYGERTADNTAYALWIGSNDLNTFFYDSNVPGTTLSTYVDCVWNVFDEVYATGGRNFFLLNRVPLHKAPYYNPVEDGGAESTWMWPDKADYNQTAYQYKMMEYSDLLNTAFDYGVPFHLQIEDRWPGASITVFDVYSLMLDVIENPSNYADYFEEPIDVTGFYNHCKIDNPLDCEPNDTPLGNFLWWDETHPTERYRKWSFSFLLSRAVLCLTPLF